MHPAPLRILGRLLLTISAALVLGSVSATAQTSAELCERGHESLQQGQYDKAIGEYNESIRLDPMNVAAFIGRGHLDL